MAALIEIHSTWGGYDSIVIKDGVLVYARFEPRAAVIELYFTDKQAAAEFVQNCDSDYVGKRTGPAVFLAADFIEKFQVS